MSWLAAMLSSDSANYTQSISLSAHLTLNNLLHTAFVLLYKQSHYKWADIISNLAFINISVLYFRCSIYSRFIQLANLPGPLAWAFISFYWTNFSMLPMSNPIVRHGALYLLWVTICGCAFQTIGDKVRFRCCAENHSLLCR